MFKKDGEATTRLDYKFLVILILLLAILCLEGVRTYKTCKCFRKYGAEKMMNKQPPFNKYGKEMRFEGMNKGCEQKAKTFKEQKPKTPAPAATTQKQEKK